MGGAELIREALEAGIVDELTIIVAPVIMGGGKRLFEASPDRSISSSAGCDSRRSPPSSTTASRAPDRALPARDQSPVPL
jgi:riboflavin biosynthesis pyrimidine reductase